MKIGNGSNLTIRANYDSEPRAYDVIRWNSTERKASEVLRSGFETWEAAKDYLDKQHITELKAPRKRAREVFPTSEVPHLWTHKVQGSARNAQGNLFFSGNTIYSYRTSYPIAEHVTNGKGKEAILFRSGKPYSNTTASHFNAVRSAIPASIPVFDVPVESFPFPTRGTWRIADVHTLALEAYASEAKEAFEQAKRARKYGNSEFGRAQSLKLTAQEYAKFFSVTFPKVLFSFLPTGKALLEFEASLKAKAERAKRAEQLDAQANARREAEQARLEALEFPAKLAAWRTGANVHFGWNVKDAYLRISSSGLDVETSKGARVPISHAVRALNIIKACISSNRSYVRNGHSEHVGHYTIGSINVEYKTVTIGCHVITFEEVLSFEPTLTEAASKLGQSPEFTR